MARHFSNQPVDGLLRHQDVNAQRAGKRSFAGLLEIAYRGAYLKEMSGEHALPGSGR
jgi:hypothetical protein